jgi:hypothetical protein
VQAGKPSWVSEPRGLPDDLLDGKHYPAHRVAYLYMTGEWPAQWVGHINRDQTDNRWANLRPGASLHLKATYRNNTSGVRGVSWSARRGKWVAQIGKTQRACFDRFEDAVRTRKLWESERLHGPAPLDIAPASLDIAPHCSLQDISASNF